MTPLDRAIDAMDGVTALASAIGVGQSTVSMWRTRGRVPAEHCPAIERATTKAGFPVPCEELRPDVDWSVLRRRRPKSRAPVAA